MNSSPQLSVAIPLHNEQSALPELLERLRAVLDVLPSGPHEIVFADDGSTDSTMSLLEEAAQKDPRIVVVSLSRNYGHQSAIKIGRASCRERVEVSRAGRPVGEEYTMG